MQLLYYPFQRPSSVPPQDELRQNPRSFWVNHKCPNLKSEESRAVRKAARDAFLQIFHSSDMFVVYRKDFLWEHVFGFAVGSHTNEMLAGALELCRMAHQSLEDGCSERPSPALSEMDALMEHGLINSKFFRDRLTLHRSSGRDSLDAEWVSLVDVEWTLVEPVEPCEEGFHMEIGGDFHRIVRIDFDNQQEWFGFVDAILAYADLPDK